MRARVRGESLLFLLLSPSLSLSYSLLLCHSAHETQPKTRAPGSLGAYACVHRVERETTSLDDDAVSSAFGSPGPLSLLGCARAYYHTEAEGMLVWGPVLCLVKSLAVFLPGHA